jgi:hypothetical protein
MIAKNPLRPGPDGIFGRHSAALIRWLKEILLLSILLVP